MQCTFLLLLSGNVKCFCLNWTEKVVEEVREDASDADSDHDHHEDDDYDDWVCGEEGLFTGSAGFFSSFTSVMPTASYFFCLYYCMVVIVCNPFL